jgi:hypothetical protein
MSGFGVSTLGRRSLRKVGEIYQRNAEIVERHRLPTLEFETDELSARRHLRAKVIDMIFFIGGA